MESEALTSALEKIRGGDPDVGASLAEEEAAALAHYLTASASDSDNELCKLVRRVLQARALPERGAEQAAAYKRTNLTLRAAIDLFLKRDFTLVDHRDVKLLQDTMEKLDAMARKEAPSPNQERLMRLIAECLGDYAAWLDREQRPGEAAAPPPPRAPTPSPPPGGALDARTFLEGAGPRDAFSALEGVPVNVSLRRIDHEGDLVLSGEFGDAFLLVNRGGSVIVHGFVFGYIIADGNIRVEGSVQGGWLYTHGGDITATRILAGSTLIAPRGNLAFGSAESPRLACCGGDCIAELGVRSGVFFAHNFTAGEAVRNATIHLRGILTAQRLEAEPQDSAALIRFRAAQTCADFGRPYPDGAVPALKNFGRTLFRRRVARALADFFSAELLNMYRAVIFALQGGKAAESALPSIRSAHCEMAALTLLIEMAEGLKELLAIGEDLGCGLDAMLLNAGLEESTVFLAFITREVKGMAREYVRDPECIEAPCRHVASFSKKLKDAVRSGKGVEKLLNDFDSRLDEWRALQQRAVVEYQENSAALAKVLGDAVWNVSDPAPLGPLLKKMSKSAEEAGKVPAVMHSRNMEALRERLEQHVAQRNQWSATAEGIRDEYNGALAALGDSVSLTLAGEGPQGIYAEKLGLGLRIQTLACATRFNAGEGGMLLVCSGQDSAAAIRVRNLRLYSDPE